MHIGVNTQTGECLALTVTDEKHSDCSQIKPILNQNDDIIEKLYADGGYDRHTTYNSISDHQPGWPVDTIVPPIETSKLPEDPSIPLTYRDKHVEYIQNNGRQKWESKHKYGQRNKAEGFFARFKTAFGEFIASRDNSIQNTEVEIKTKLLNEFNSFYNNGFRKVKA